MAAAAAIKHILELGTTHKGKDKVDKLGLLFVRSQMRKIL
jgi:hypothetical protein